jgi:hypothetical protein
MATKRPSLLLGMAQLGALLLAGFGLAGCGEDDTVSPRDLPPAVPTGVTTVTGDGWVEIQWNPVREEDVVGYGVYRSRTLEGAYNRIATVEGVESTSYLDTHVINGVTYYYAVDAFDEAGNESDLSYEDAFDTPRPAGTNVVVFALEEVPSSSGIDFSEYDRPGFVTAFDAPGTDVYFHRASGVLYAKGTLIGGFWNDIQDLGYTESMDEISWAPTQGWSVSPLGVELIEGHTYVVWTWDSFFAKFRVVEVLSSLSNPGIPSGARIDWAYQIDPNNPELAPGRLALGEGRVQERGDS